jgi:hypothetical protein
MVLATRAAGGPSRRGLLRGACLLLAIAPFLVSCLESDTAYERPRSMDTPSIYALQA